VTTAPLLSSTKTCCGQCGTRYVVTRRTDGSVELRYTPQEQQRCEECGRTDKAEEMNNADSGN